MSNEEVSLKNSFILMAATMAVTLVGGSLFIAVLFLFVKFPWTYVFTNVAIVLLV